MIKAIIFDLDGTLANTLNTITHFANAALEKHGYREIETQKYRYLVGDGADNLVRGMLRTIDVEDTDEDSFDKVRQDYNKSYDDHFMYLTTAYEGIPELLSSLKAMGIKIGVLSNKPHSTTQKIVETLFPKQFELCYGKREAVPRKPDPTALLSMLDEFNISAEECLYVGDTSTDMQTGHYAKLFTIGVLWGFRDREELEQNDADYLVSSPFEILEYVVRNSLA